MVTVDLERLSKYTPAERAAIQLAAQRELCRTSFVDFLRFVKIRSDDPLNPGIVPWQRWDYLLERAAAWESGQSEVDLKARQLGISWLISAFLYWRAGYHGMQCAYLSVGQKEAREELRRVAFIHENLPQHLQIPGQINVDDARFSSGGAIVAFPSTEQAGISFTFGVAVMDEAAFHPYGAQNYSALRPTVSAGGQVLILSTSDPGLGPSGFFHDMYWASKRGDTPYKAVFIPWHSRPGRDEAWYETERRAFAGLPDAFHAYYPSSDEEAFVGRSGLVYPQFSQARHVKTNPCRWAEYKIRVAGVDFGGGDPTAIVPLGVTHKEHVHQPTEWYQPTGAVTSEQIANRLFKLHNIAPFMSIECDPSQPIVIRDLQALGLPARPANNRRGEGLGAVGWLLDNDRLTIAPTCQRSLAEFPTYRWKESTDPNDKTKYATATPVDHHADAMDARRYAVMRLLPLLRTSAVMEQGITVVI